MNQSIMYGRKRKGIVNQLRAKISDWLLSIDNEELVTDIKRDLIITGGSIASMLLGEKVNDYDLYFRTKATAEKVARYYVDRFNARVNLTNCNSYSPVVKVEDRENCKGETESRVLIYMQSAGVAGEDQNNYEYFEQLTGEAAEEFAESLNETGEGEAYRPTFLSQNAITLSNDVQIVIRFYGEPDKIHSNYDFAHAMCYYDYHNDHLELPGEALECLLSRTLIYRGSLYPIASIFRMKKFLTRGWRINAGQMLKIMWQISELNLKDKAVLSEQLTGVDMAYMWQLIDALQGTDADKIDSAYVSTIIDRIFE